MSDAPLPPAGWYPDPDDAARERWWNGSTWSENRRPAPGALTAPGFVAPGGAAATTEAPPWAVASGDPARAPGDPRPDPYAPVQPQYAGARYPGYAAPYGAPAPSPTNGLAVAGFVLSLAGAVLALLFGPLLAIAGIILSALGLAAIRKRAAAGQPATGRGLALAGLVIGIVVVVLSILVGVLYFVFLLGVGYPS